MLCFNHEYLTLIISANIFLKIQAWLLKKSSYLNVTEDKCIFLFISLSLRNSLRLIIIIIRIFDKSSCAKRCLALQFQFKKDKNMIWLIVNALKLISILILSSSVKYTHDNMQPIAFNINKLFWKHKRKQEK